MAINLLLSFAALFFKVFLYPEDTLFGGRFVQFNLSDPCFLKNETSFGWEVKNYTCIDLICPENDTLLNYCCQYLNCSAKFSSGQSWLDGYYTYRYLGFLALIPIFVIVLLILVCVIPSQHFFGHRNATKTSQVNVEIVPGGVAIPHYEYGHPSAPESSLVYHQNYPTSQAYVGVNQAVPQTYCSANQPLPQAYGATHQSPAQIYCTTGQAGPQPYSSANQAMPQVYCATCQSVAQPHGSPNQAMPQVYYPTGQALPQSYGSSNQPLPQIYPTTGQYIPQVYGATIHFQPR